MVKFLRKDNLKTTEHIYRKEDKMETFSPKKERKNEGHNVSI